MDCSSVHGISQAGILEWVAIPPPGDLPDPGTEPMSLTSPALAGRWILCHCTTWEALLGWDFLEKYHTRDSFSQKGEVILEFDH